MANYPDDTRPTQPDKASSPVEATTKPIPASRTRIDYLVRYWVEKCSQTPTTTLRSAIAGAMLNCLTLQEIVSLILEGNRGDERLREKVVTRLLDEAARSPRTVYESVVKRLLEAVPNLAYSRKVTVSYFLERLHGLMPPAGQEEITRFYFDSDAPSVRRRGYKLLRKDWRSEWEPEVRRRWEQWHEPEVAAVIVDHFDSAFLVEHLDELANDLTHPGNVARLYARACAREAGLLAKLV